MFRIRSVMYCVQTHQCMVYSNLWVGWSVRYIVCGCVEEGVGVGLISLSNLH